MMKWVIYMMAGAALLASFPYAAPAETLIVGSPEWIPWQILDREQVTGITIDILQALDRRIDYIRLEVKPLPHKRMMVAFKSQQINAEPSVNPLWRAEQQDISVYTVPYCTTCDIILVRRDSGIKGTSVDDFKGLSLGCGLGYYYPEGFQEAFERGDIIREDNATGAKNLMKLSLKRIDGAIMDKVQARYMLKQSKMNPDDFKTAFQFKPSKLSLRLHRSKKAVLPALNQAIESMTADGTIERIVAAYTQ